MVYIEIPEETTSDLIKLIAFPVEELRIVYTISFNGVMYSFDELLRHRSVSADLAVKMSRIKRGAVVRNTIGVINYD